MRSSSMAASVIMATVHGYESAPKDDPFLDNADKAITLMTNSMFPGSSIANSLPFLRFFPSWFPDLKPNNVSNSLIKNSISG